MSDPGPRRLNVGGEASLVKFAGPYSHRGSPLWLAKAIITWDEGDRVIPGDARDGSQDDRVAAVGGAGRDPGAALRDLERKLARMSSPGDRST